jgi:hypothetical protein
MIVRETVEEGRNAFISFLVGVLLLRNGKEAMITARIILIMTSNTTPQKTPCKYPGQSSTCGIPSR